MTKLKRNTKYLTIPLIQPILTFVNSESLVANLTNCTLISTQFVMNVLTYSWLQIRLKNSGALNICTHTIGTPIRPYSW